MKNKIKYPIIVEGLSDKNKILNLFDALVIITNGNDFDEGLLILFNKHNIPVLLMLDPDKQGCVISKKMSQLLNKHIVVEYIDPVFVSDKKHGVAELDNEYLIELLVPYINDSNTKQLTTSDLYSLGLSGHADSASLRGVICKHLGIKKRSTKELLTIFNCLNLSLKDIEKYVDR